MLKKPSKMLTLLKNFFKEPYCAGCIHSDTFFVRTYGDIFCEKYFENTCIKKDQTNSEKVEMELLDI